MSTYPEQEKKYENVLNYLTYMSHYDSIGIELFQEIDTLEEDLKNKLFRNDSEVTLDRLYRFVDILEHLFDFSLTKEDADYFYSYRDEINVENFRTFIEDEARKAKQTLMLPKEVDLINQDIPKIEKFYQAALKRDHELIDRAYRKMVDSNGQVSIIVTGGFHPPGIERYLKEKDTSYLVTAPRITKTIDERKESKLYEAAMKNEPTRLEKMLAEVYMPPKSTTLNDPRYQLGQPKVTAMTISDFVRSGYPDKNWAASKVTLDRVIPMFLEMARRYQTLGGLNSADVDDGWGGFLDVGFEALGERTNQKYDRNLQTEKIAERSEMRKTAANGLVIELVPTVLNGKEIRPTGDDRTQRLSRMFRFLGVQREWGKLNLQEQAAVIDFVIGTMSLTKRPFFKSWKEIQGNSEAMQMPWVRDFFRLQQPPTYNLNAFRYILVHFHPSMGDGFQDPSVIEQSEDLRELWAIWNQAENKFAITNVKG